MGPDRHAGELKVCGPGHRWQCACTSSAHASRIPGDGLSRAHDQAPPGRASPQEAGRASPQEEGDVPAAPARVGGGAFGSESVSLWMATETIAPRPPLARSQAADVCVVGAGIAGLTRPTSSPGPASGRRARRRPDRRRRDRPHDRAPLATRSTTATTRSSGCTATTGARLAAESHAAAIDRDRGDRARRGDRLRLRAGRRLPVPAPGRVRRECSSASSRPRTRAGLDRRRAARARAAARASTPGRACASRDQAQFHPLRYLAGLAARDRAARRPHLHRRPRRGGRRRAARRAGRAPRPGARSRPTRSSSRPTRRSTTCVAIHTKQAAYLHLRDRRARAAPAPCRTRLYWDTARSVPLRARCSGGRLAADRARC